MCQQESRPLTFQFIPELIIANDMAYRSRKGCHTCKKRHKKCDETRPICLRCSKGGFHCAGYDLRLTWGPEGTTESRGVVLHPVRQKRAQKKNKAPSTLLDGSNDDAQPLQIDADELQYSFSQWELDIISHEPSYDSPNSEDATEKRLMGACKLWSWIQGSLALILL